MRSRTEAIQAERERLVVTLAGLSGRDCAKAASTRARWLLALILGLAAGAFLTALFLLAPKTAAQASFDARQVATL